MLTRLLLLAALAPFTVTEDDPRWVRHVIAEGFSSQTAIAADFTGDGLPDVIASDITYNRTILYVAPDWKPVVLNTGPRTIHGAVIDVDGDGDPDYIGAQYNPGLLYWLERPKNPLQDPWPMHIIDDTAKGGISGIHGLLAADVDRDGNLDLIATSGQPTGAFPDSLAWFSIHRRQGAAPELQRHIFADRDATGLSHYLAFADVNGDGRGDIASAAKESPGGNWFAWWEQPRDPRKPWKKHLIAENQFAATNILIADVNGDHKPDFTGSRGHGEGLVWFEAPNWTPHEIGQGLKGIHALAAADIDGDGDIDIAGVAKDSRIAFWMENDGKGGFTRHVLSRDQSAYDARLVDIDNDGDLDLLVAGFESKNVVWYENKLKR